METVPEIIEKIKTDERRRKFFKDRLQSDLKRLGISCQEEQIEQYMIEAIHTFHGNLSVQLFPHILKYTKEKIFKEEKHERKYEKNNLFSDEEMVIIEQYLEKDQNGHYKDTEEIANNLGTTITEVTKTTYKLNQQFIKKPKQIKQIFGDIEKTLKMRQRKKDRRSKNKHLITKQDIEIIGIFTGQINDICLDIDELAVKKNTTSQKMLERLRNIYQLLDIEENYSELIKQYPNIHSMLKLKCRTLGISAPVMVAVFECVNFFKTLYQKDEKGNYLKLNEVAQKLGFRHYSTFVSKRKTLLKRLEDDEDFQRKVLVKYPTFIRDKEQYEKNFNNTEPSQNKQEQKPHQVQEKKPKPKQKTKSKRLENDIIFLQYLYKKQENGRYLTNSEIAKLLDIKVTSISTKKTNTLKKLENKVYKAKILAQYPELDQDMETKSVENDIIFLQYLYQKQDEGNYLSNSEIAELLDIKVHSVSKKKKTILEKLEDQEYKAKILERYPELDQDIEKKKNNPHRKYQETKETKLKRLKKDVQTLKYFYQKKEDGSYLTNSEIAKLLDIKVPSVYTKKKTILKKLEDQEYKALVLERYPELDQDMEIKSVENDIIFLQYLYQKQDEGNYLSNSGIAKLLDIKIPSVSIKKKAILEKLENKVYKAKILERYPELDEDIKKKESTQEENDRSKQLSNNEKKLADFLFTDQTRELGRQSSYARKLEITPNYYYLLKDNTLSKIKNNPNIQKSYPSFLVENEIISKYRRKNSITLSKQEFNQIKKNARKYDIPNYQQEKPNRKDLFMKGIKSLENSEYSNYTSLCTFEQKAMLALRLGFFNEMSFSSSDVAELFHVEQEEVQILTQECIKSSKDLPLNDKNQKIKATKK